MSERNPSLADVILAALDARLQNVHTIMIGEVETFDPDTQTANVRPMVKRMNVDYNNNYEEQEYPVIPSCMVVYVGSNKKFVDYQPLEKGNKGLLLFCENSIETWQGTGKMSSVASFRRHNIADATFLFGLLDEPTAKEMAANLPSDGKLIGVRDDDAQALFQAGKISLGGEGSNDWVAHAGRVEERLTKIENAIRNGKPVAGAGGDGGTAYQETMVAILDGPSPSVASTLVALKD